MSAADEAFVMFGGLRVLPAEPHPSPRERLHSRALPKIPMIKRALNAWRIYRHRGAARMPAWLWLHWIVTGRYPRF